MLNRYTFKATINNDSLGRDEYLSHFSVDAESLEIARIKIRQVAEYSLQAFLHVHPTELHLVKYQLTTVK